MKRYVAVLFAVLFLVAMPGSTLHAQIGGLKLPGFGSAPAASGKSPTAYVVLATVEFLTGGQLLMEATDKATEAAKMGEVAKQLKSDGPTTANLGEVDKLAAEMKKIADDKQTLDKADQKKVTEAAIHVGVASYFEKLGVDAAKGGGLKNLANIGSAAETAVLAVAAPTNLNSMLSVQTTLFKYLQAKGIDPSADVQKQIAQMEKQ
jgi:hypothetical protein